MAGTIKTNVMRLLDGRKIPYTPREYDPSLTEGTAVAAALLQDAGRVFKTLVARADSGEYCVFVVPVRDNLDVKKAARAAAFKAVSMIKQKELLPLTGYIHGGCSPIGMKRAFKTLIHESALAFDTIFVSAGRVGFQIEISPQSLSDMVGAAFADITDDG